MRAPFGLAALQQIKVQLDIGNRGAQFVADARDELIFKPIKFLEPRNVAINANKAGQFTWFIAKRSKG